MKASTWRWAALGIFIFASAAVADSANLIANGGFENADGDQPAGFETGNVNVNDLAVLTWDAPGHQSERCVSVETLSASALGYWQTIVEVEPETTYTLSLMYRTRDRDAGGATRGEAQYNQGRPGGPNIELGVMPRSDKPTTWSDMAVAMEPLGGLYIAPSTEWRRFSHTFTTRPDQTQLVIKLRLYCYAQKAWFDDLSLVEGDAFKWNFRIESLWRPRDTTPPTVFRPTPPPNTGNDADVMIAAKLDGAATAQMWLDDRDVTADATIGDDAITLQATQLAPGVHRVRVVASDAAGNPSNTLQWQFGVGAPLHNDLDVTTSPMQLNGEPYFPIAIYAYACHPDDGRFRPDHLRQAADSGFNLVLNTIEKRAGLDKELAAGIMGTLNITYDLKACDDPASAHAALFELGQARLADHPAVLGYWCDDPENIENTDGTPVPATTLHKLEQARDEIKRTTPGLPMIFAISNLPRLVASIPFGDVLLGYRYPAPHYHPMMMYGWTIHYYQQVVTNKPIWYLSQGVDLGYGPRFGLPQSHRPTAAEMRAMAYYSLVCDVDGYALYGNYLNHEDFPDHWREAMRLGMELRYLSPALARGERGNQASIETDPTSSAIFYCEIVHDGVHTLLAVNMSASRLHAVWCFDEPTAVSVLFEDLATAAPTMRVADVFAPWQVHVYQWR